MPRGLLEVAERDNRQAWMSTLPGLVHDLAAEWSLELGEPFQPGGETAWVAPVEGPSGERLVLKVVWRHPEAEHEADGLAAWAGRGAIRLHASKSFDETLVLLVERCSPGTELRSRPEPEQDIVIAGLLRRLWIQPGPAYRFRPLGRMCEQWADGFDTKLADHCLELDPGLVREAIGLFRELPTSAASEVLLCTDLHAGNVLAAEREPWLAIDPKPYVGDPTYDPLQHMLNCEQRLRTDPRGLATRMAGLLDLDRDRLLNWLFARCVQFSPSWPFLAEVARAIAPN
ncbi:MAG: aminoglycoside phosphotransferase family protein [Acidimicrobiales bacterium]